MNIKKYFIDRFVPIHNEIQDNLEVQESQVNSLYESSRLSIYTVLSLAILTYAVLYPVADIFWLSLWFCFQLIVFIVRFWNTKSYYKWYATYLPKTNNEERQKRDNLVRHKKYKKHFLYCVLFSGICWGMSLFVPFNDPNPMNRILLAFIISAICAGSIATMSSVWYVNMLFILSALSFVVIKFLFLGGAIYTTIAVMAVLYMANLISNAIKIYSQNTQNVILTQESHRRQIELEIEKDKSEAANRAKSKFLSSMSHELRTPLNAIMGFSELMKIDLDIGVKNIEMATEINNASHHLLDIVSDILDLSAIEQGKLNLNMTDVGVYEIINDVIKLLCPLKDKYNVTIINNITEKYNNICLHVDRIRFRQAIFNIASNAIKYNKKNGFVYFELTVLDKSIVLEIRDTGIGIDDSKQSLMFEQFSRLGAENTTIEGTGLGLNITKNIVTVMGGEIAYKSKQNEGTSFYLTFNRAPNKNIHSSSLNTTTAKDANQEISFNFINKQIKMLYVEDNNLNRQIFKKMIDTQFKFVDLIMTETAEDGWVEIEKNNFDFVVLDINLPGISGIDLVKIIRQSEKQKWLLVVAFSADAMEEEISNAMLAGFDDYLVKPLQIEKFKLCFYNLLKDTGIRIL